MIIQCEQCQTRFRLDDSKVTDRGVKVRCAKCRHVFTVAKGGEETQSDFGALLDQSTATGAEQEPVAPFAPEQESPAAQPPPEPGFDYSDFVTNEFSGESEGPDAGASEPPLEERSPLAAAGDDLSLDGEQGFFPGQDQSGDFAADVDFGGHDFGADRAEAAGATLPEFGPLDMDESPAATTAGGAEEGTDFAFGGEPPLGETVAATPAGEADSFSLDGFAFGEEPPPAEVQQGDAGEPEPVEQPPVAPSAGTSASVPVMEASQADQEEPPPLSIPSRRRQNPLFSVLIAVATVVAVAVLGFFGYNRFMEEKVKVASEAGRITLRAVDAAFVKSQAAGELLVISGEAVNGFAKPRASIQVKGMVYGAGGQVLATKSAYCGNPLTKEQLAGMPLEKIETAMANQFGDSLANMEVPPGKAIPFVIVIAKPPADAREYGVEPAGSTVATGKAQ